MKYSENKKSNKGEIFQLSISEFRQKYFKHYVEK